MTDTMLTEHRISPESEKSLSHCIAKYTTLPYHKDQGIEPFNDQQERQLWTYNARDVHAMRLIHQRQSSLVRQNINLAKSVDQVNESIYPYRLIELKGLKVDEAELDKQKQKFMQIYDAWSRILNTLVGYEINPASGQQVGNYLYNEMKYPVLERTEKGKDATGTKTLYRLLVRHKNPAIQLIIKLREVAKTVSMLNFESV